MTFLKSQIDAICYQKQAKIVKIRGLLLVEKLFTGRKINTIKKPLAPLIRSEFKRYRGLKSKTINLLKHE